MLYIVNQEISRFLDIPSPLLAFPFNLILGQQHSLHHYITQYSTKQISLTTTEAFFVICIKQYKHVIYTCYVAMTLETEGMRWELIP